MDNDKTFNRLSGYFDEGLEQAGHLETKVREEAAALAQKARESLRHKSESVVSAEETLVKALQEHQKMLLIAGASLVAALILTSFLYGTLARLKARAQ